MSKLLNISRTTLYTKLDNACFHNKNEWTNKI